MNRTTRLATTIASLTLVFTVAACSTSPRQAGDPPPVNDINTSTSNPADRENPTTSEAQAILAEFGYDASDVKTVVDTLDALPVAERSAALIASVRPNVLALTTDDGREASIPMPDDEFYLSIAPYLTSTHDCHFHSLTTCRGELANATVDVTVRDDATGKTLAQGSEKTFDNGFLGLWLPRGITATVTIDYQGRQSEKTISTTGDDDATCLTTMQLT